MPPSLGRPLPGCILCTGARRRPDAGQAALRSYGYNREVEKDAVILDTPNARHILAEHQRSLPLLLRLNSPPERYDAIGYGEVDRPRTRPNLMIERISDLIADGAVAGDRGAPAEMRRDGERTDQIGPADDADDMAGTHDRDTLYALLLEQFCNLAERRRFGNGLDLRGHHVDDAGRVFTRVFCGESGIVPEQVEPP